jgi:FeS assembly SUF system regulator
LTRCQPGSIIKMRLVWSHIRMLKLSKKADYALIAVRHLATHRNEPSLSASDIAQAYGISAPLLAKVLQRLAKHGLLTARHGSSGGYQLARHPNDISALDVINAVDGPVVITSCVTSHGNCDQSLTCTVREPLRRVNESIARVLRSVTISQMSEDSPDAELVGLSV